MTGIQKRVRFKYPLKQSRIRWALFSMFDIPCDPDKRWVYLRRLRIVQTPWFGAYLHFMYAPDLDQDPHDHPWPFWSLILRGGYQEDFYHLDTCCVQEALTHCVYQMRFWKRWSFHKVDMDEVHQIMTIQPGTISLVFVGRRRREWGFYTSEGFVDWREYKEGRAT